MSNCPKCNAKIKYSYLKQECPNCGVNMLYYKLDEQLEADAALAQKEVDTVNEFIGLLKDSSIKTPLHIIRLILFFTPLASMCLPMFWAGHKNVSLITFIMSIVNHGFDIGAMLADKSYFFAVLSMVLVILLSICVIICSLFSETKSGFRRNAVFSGINTFAFLLISVLCLANGGIAKSGFYTTALIYCLEAYMQYAVAKPKNTKRLFAAGVSVLACIAVVVASLFIVKPQPREITAATTADVSVVSFNVASAFGTKFEDTDSMTRCTRFANYMKKYSPDLIGTQEINSYWIDELSNTMNEYEIYSVKRGGDSEENNSEMNAVFWNKSKFTCLEKNTVWLSETPNVESKYTYVDENGDYAEAGCNRICTYVVLKEKETAKTVGFFNTHLDNASQQAADFGAKVVLSQIESVKSEYGEDLNIILSGDFNSDSDSNVYKIITEKLNDSTDYSLQQPTYQKWGYGQTGDKPIDFIFTNGKSKCYIVLDAVDDGYVSDHYGILTTVDF